MKITNLNTPFYHTVIEDFFNIEELKIIDEDLIQLNLDNKFSVDGHHSDLVQRHGTRAFCLDQIYEGRREESPILRCMRKIFGLDADGLLDKTTNPFLNYLRISNKDTTFVQMYQDKCAYGEHQDGSVLTMLYVLYNEPKSYSGGDLIFTSHDYQPEIKNNSCLIFPSYELHKVTPIQANDEYLKRFSINQRIYVV